MKEKYFIQERKDGRELDMDRMSLLDDVLTSVDRATASVP